MAQQTKVVGNVTRHAPMMEGDVSWYATLGICLGMGLHCNVDVGFSNDGNLHDSFVLEDKSRKLL